LYRNGGWGTTRTYVFESGLVALPLADTASGGTPVEIVQLFQPYRVSTVEYAAEKANAPPIIPTPKDNVWEYILSAQMSFPQPAIDPGGGQLIWSAFGSQQFVERGPWTVATGFRIGDSVTQATPLVLDQSVGINPGLTGEELGELVNFTTPSNADYVYNCNTHFPSQFLIDNLIVGT
jgi:hypothetical protein